MKIDLTKAIELVITLLVFIFTTFVVPYIRSKNKDEKLKEILKWTKIAVQAAEMIFRESGMGAEKKAYVLKFLDDKGYYLDPESMDNIIESAVLEMKHAIEG